MWVPVVFHHCLSSRLMFMLFEGPRTQQGPTRSEDIPFLIIYCSFWWDEFYLSLTEVEALVFGNIEIQKVFFREREGEREKDDSRQTVQDELGKLFSPEVSNACDSVRAADIPTKLIFSQLILKAFPSTKPTRTSLMFTKHKKHSIFRVEIFYNSNW